MRVLNKPDTALNR